MRNPSRVPGSSRANQLFSQNVRALVSHYQNAHKKTLVTIAKEMQISPRNLTYARAGQHAATLDTVQAVADFFGLDVWQLFIEDLPAEILLNPNLARVVRNVVRATVEGQVTMKATSAK